MTFLEREQKARGFYARSELADKCWPEILAVIEKARRECDIFGEAEQLKEALEALDKKAGEG